MRLIKTTGGNDGAPAECYKCGSRDFVSSGIAWHCIICGTYYPTALGFESIKKKLQTVYDRRPFIRQRGPDGLSENT
jgi:hypothetical protein